MKLLGLNLGRYKLVINLKYKKDKSYNITIYPFLFYISKYSFKVFISLNGLLQLLPSHK
ncbi:hypothetical protein GCM10008917_03480 [Paraclostridium tenue]|uniref:Uncharacterized protein n=1 Tax=Paraclostridium tenue TaxID=1737 RepID=A0ABP3XBW2_9FIRM